MVENSSIKKSKWDAYNPLKKKNRLFTAVVVIPTLLSAIYFGLIASDVYISESQFVIRSPKNTASLTGIGAFLQSAGFARSADDTHTVHAYMRSRDALSGLNHNGDIAIHYSDKKIDMVSRFNNFGSSEEMERLFQYFQKKIVKIFHLRGKKKIINLWIG